MHQRHTTLVDLSLRTLGNRPIRREPHHTRRSIHLGD
jgi:hypothetical protein